MNHFVLMPHPSWIVCLRNLRAKIDSIIARNTPHPDPDAPEDPASVRFWANCGGVASEVESTKLQASAQATVQSTGDILSSIVGSDPMAPDTGRVANGPTLRALVDVASTPVEAPTAKSKAKAKAKAKSRVSQQNPKTPAEQRNAIRIFHMLRLHICFGLYFTFVSWICRLLGNNYYDYRFFPVPNGILRIPAAEGIDAVHRCGYRFASGRCHPCAAAGKEGGY